MVAKRHRGSKGGNLHPQKEIRLKKAEAKVAKPIVCELQMECVDDDLSAAQLKAIEQAKIEHEKANELIKTIRAGNILVPSSQPNTFTIVPPKVPILEPPLLSTPNSKVQFPIASNSVALVSDQRGLPPPRPVQFLNKQQQGANKPQVVKASPDIIIISESPPHAAGSTLSPPQTKSTLRSTQLQTMTLISGTGQNLQMPILPSPGATPQQVYKFVSLPSNQPAPLITNKWANRPFLMVPPQQQTFIQSGGITPPALMQMATLGSPSPRQMISTGEQCDTKGGWNDSVVKNSVKYNVSPQTNRTRSSYEPYKQQRTSSKVHNWDFPRFSRINRVVTSLAVSWKRNIHIVQVAEHFNKNKACQAYRVSQVQFDVLKSVFSQKHRKLKKCQQIFNGVETDTLFGHVNSCKTFDKHFKCDNDLGSEVSNRGINTNCRWLKASENVTHKCIDYDRDIEHNHCTACVKENAVMCSNNFLDTKQCNHFKFCEHFQSDFNDLQTGHKCYCSDNQTATVPVENFCFLNEKTGSADFSDKCEGFLKLFDLVKVSVSAEDFMDTETRDNSEIDILDHTDESDSNCESFKLCSDSINCSQQSHFQSDFIKFANRDSKVHEKSSMQEKTEDIIDVVKVDMSSKSSCDDKSMVQTFVTKTGGLNGYNNVNCDIKHVEPIFSGKPCMCFEAESSKCCTEHNLAETIKTNKVELNIFNKSGVDFKFTHIDTVDINVNNDGTTLKNSCNYKLDRKEKKLVSGNNRYSQLHQTDLTFNNIRTTDKFGQIIKNCTQSNFEGENGNSTEMKLKLEKEFDGTASKCDTSNQPIEEEIKVKVPLLTSENSNFYNHFVFDLSKSCSVKSIPKRDEFMSNELPKPKKFLWYQNISWEDIVYTVVMCCKYGFTMMSKKLQIPKTQLLKWSRTLKKIYCVHPDHKMDSCQVSEKDLTEKSNDAKTPSIRMKCKNVKWNSTLVKLKINKNHEGMKTSLLKTYFPTVYLQACELLSELEHNSSDIEIGTEQEHLAHIMCDDLDMADESREISDASLEICQVHQFQTKPYEMIMIDGSFCEIPEISTKRFFGVRRDLDDYTYLHRGTSLEIGHQQHCSNDTVDVENNFITNFEVSSKISNFISESLTEEKFIVVNADATLSNNDGVSECKTFKFHETEINATEMTDCLQTMTVKNVGKMCERKVENCFNGATNSYKTNTNTDMNIFYQNIKKKAVEDTSSSCNDLITTAGKIGYGVRDNCYTNLSPQLISDVAALNHNYIGDVGEGCVGLKPISYLTLYCPDRCLEFDSTKLMLYDSDTKNKVENLQVIGNYKSSRAFLENRLHTIAEDIYGLKTIVMVKKEDYNIERINRRLKMKLNKPQRMLFSTNLRIKLANLCKQFGIYHVAKEYNIKSRTLRTWCSLLKNRKLTSYDLVNDELLELVEYNIQKLNSVNISNIYCVKVQSTLKRCAEYLHRVMGNDDNTRIMLKMQNHSENVNGSSHTIELMSFIQKENNFEDTDKMGDFGSVSEKKDSTNNKDKKNGIDTTCIPGPDLHEEQKSVLLLLPNNSKEVYFCSDDSEDNESDKGSELVQKDVNSQIFKQVDNGHIGVGTAKTNLNNVTHVFGQDRNNMNEDFEQCSKNGHGSNTSDNIVEICSWDKNNNSDCNLNNFSPNLPISVKGDCFESGYDIIEKCVPLNKLSSVMENCSKGKYTFFNRLKHENQSAEQSQCLKDYSNTVQHVIGEQNKGASVETFELVHVPDSDEEVTIFESADESGAQVSLLSKPVIIKEEPFDEIFDKIEKRFFIQKKTKNDKFIVTRHTVQKEQTSRYNTDKPNGNSNSCGNNALGLGNENQQSQGYSFSQNSKSSESGDQNTALSGSVQNVGSVGFSTDGHSSGMENMPASVLSANNMPMDQEVIFLNPKQFTALTLKPQGSQQSCKQTFTNYMHSTVEQSHTLNAVPCSQAVAGIITNSNIPVQCSGLNSQSTLLGKNNRNVIVCQPANETDGNRNSICVPGKNLLLGSKNVVVPSDILQKKQYETIGFFSRPRNQALTIQGMGSISTDTIPVTSSILQAVLTQPLNSTNKVQGTSSSSGRDSVQFFTPIQNNNDANPNVLHIDDNELDKQRTLLKTMHDHKAKLQVGGEAYCGTLTAKVSSSAKFVNSAALQTKQIESNRINNLIKTVTNRVNINQGDSIVNQTVSNLGKNQSHTKINEPLTASEILFGKRTSAQTTRDQVNEKVKSHLAEVEESSSESASSVSTVSVKSSESGTIVSDDKLDRESVNLSDKLKSLLKADIFSSFECDVKNQQESEADELIELLAGSPEKKNECSQTTTAVLNNQTLWSEKKCKEQPLDNQSSTASSKFVYSSDSLQKKLGKLCTIFSIASISKKYGVNPRTLSKWKAMYKDEEIAVLELTADDKKELQEMSAFKRKYNVCAGDTYYQIYFDNPELDYDEAGGNKNCSQTMDVQTSNPCQENRYSQDVASCSPFTKDKVELKKHLFCIQAAENVPLCQNVGLSLESSAKKPVDHQNIRTPNAEMDPDLVPLYIAAANSMPENLRQHIRQKIKFQRPIDASLKKSVFMASDCNVSTSSKTDKTPECTDNIAKTVIINKSHSESEILLTCRENQGANSLVKTAVLPTSAEGTLYLCPNEGDSRKKHVTETSSCQKQERSKRVHPDISKKKSRSSETGEQNSQVIAESDVPLRSIDSRSSLSSLIKDSIGVDMVEDLGLKHNVDVKYSEGFKWKVVEEARKSGFENTAKWFNISMTDIMKWHDLFLRKKPIKESKTNCSPSVQFDQSPVCIEIDSAIESNTEYAKVEAVPCSKIKGLNAGLLFEQFQSKEGAIMKPRFNTSTLNKPSQSIESLSNTILLPVTNKQKVQGSPSAIKYLLAKSPSSQKQGHNVVYDVQYQADVQRDLGIMPKLVKPMNVSLSKDGIEIASTWKQVQSLLKPAKSSEKKYSQEFKNRMIKECEQKGQKIVSKEHKIPYNELSRWRLEAKKVPLVFQSNISATQSTTPASVDISPGYLTADKETVKKKVITAVDTSSALVAVEEDEGLGNIIQESLKIKIKLSNLPDRSKPSNNKNLSLAKDETKTKFVEDGETIRKSSTYGKSVETNFSHPSNTKEPDTVKKCSLRVKNSQNVEEVKLNEQEQMKMTVINYCFDQGVLKTQKKFNFTRQSILDLIKEYEAVNKNTSDDEYNYHKIIRTLRTRLVSREKTSVEDAAVDTRQPILVKNLNDYIVTQEYKHNVVDYARKHGITAASRKFKRKSSTVRRWITEFQKEEKKKITVEQEHRQRELMITQNMSFDEAKKIAQLQAVRKRKLLEMEFRKHIVAFAKEFGITAATKKFKRKAQVVKSWMGHFEKSERDTKRLMELKQTEDPNQTKILEKQGKFPTKPLIVQQGKGLHETSGLLTFNNNSHSHLWDQDFIIKPNSNKSPLKLTLSPRRKSSPVIAVGSSSKDNIIEDDLVDEEMDDFEIEDQEDDGQYVEVCAWEEPHNKNKEVVSIDVTDKDDQDMHEKKTDKILNLESMACISDAEISSKTQVNLVLSNCNLDHSVSMKNSDKQPENDSFINPTDVPNIFDTRHQAEHEIMKITNDESTSTVSKIDTVVDAESLILQDSKEKAIESCSNLFSFNDIVVSQIPDSVTLNQNADDLKKEFDIKLECVELDEYVPYKETIMFKLLTAEVDNFFNVNLPGSCDIVETNISQQNQTKISLKKTKRTADFEIMENIEETCLFNAPRSSRNILRENESVLDDPLFTKNCKSDPVGKMDLSKSIETTNETDKTEKQSDCAIISTLEICRNKQLENSHEDIEVANENETKLERSLFDFFNIDENVKSEQIEDNSSEKSKIVTKEQTLVKTTTGTSLSIFGSIFKNFKMPSSLIMKAQNNESANETNSSNIIRSQDEIRIDTNSDAVNDNKIAESGERNLFDMISFQSEHKEAVNTSIVTKESTSPIEKPMVKDNMLKAGIKASIFKFPKLALPINFGNIAKLGIAKMKKDEKATNTKLLDEINPKIETSINKSTVMVNEKLPNNQNGKCSLKSNSVETGVVMETFEELRKRLAKERAANRQAKEKLVEESVHETIAKNITDLKEDIGTKDSSVLNEGDIDYEIYKDFTSEKIILILDIARKHGIEFASTSFDLPVSVIVNWIIEKDRKHRRITFSENLEQKLQVLRDMSQLKLCINEVAKKYEVDPSSIEKWNLEIGWLLENKNVLCVLDKWREVEPVSRLSLEMCGRKSCKESISSEANAVNSSSNIKQEMEDINLCDRTENILSSDVNLADIFQTAESGPPSSSTKVTVPEILSFTKTLNPRDYTIEQKAMIVILIDKYGIREVYKRLALNTGTLWTWKNQNKAIKQYLEEQTKMFHKPKNAENGIASTSGSSKEKLAESVQHNIVRKKQQFEKSKSTKNSIASTSSKASSKNNDLDVNVLQEGYRIISPTKLPEVLHDCQKIPTKDYTFDQRVAIVKLVDLYGVRTIHKQFRISQGSIWNWQHDKKIMAEKSRQKLFNDKTEYVGQAEACLNFDEVDCQPINVDTILDRVLVAVESIDHLKFTVDQKADVVCMIQHFGLDYVAEKMPHIPKGTIWNWQHNKIVLPLVDKKMELLKKSLESRDQKNVMSVTVDKIDLTEKWLNDCQASGRKRKVGLGDEYGDHVKKIKSRSIDDKQTLRNTCDQNVFDVGSVSSTGLKTDTNSDRMKNRIHSEERRSKHYSSPSTISSETSICSEDFEEIVSDDEKMTELSLTSRSKIDVNSSQSAKSAQKSNKSSASVKSVDSYSLTLDLNNTEIQPKYEVLKLDCERDGSIMVCYKIVNGQVADSLKQKLVETGNKRSATGPVGTPPPAKKKIMKEEELGVTDTEGNWLPLDEYYYGIQEGSAEYTEDKGEYRFKCWYCSKMLYNNVRAMQHIQGHIDASKQQNIDLSDLTQCKYCYKQFDTPFEMQTHVEKVHLSNKVLMCRICEKDFSTARELMHHMGTSHHANEMPYLCQLCNFRSSMYSDVVDHFKKKHDSSHHLLCLYCLRTFQVKFCSQGWGQTQTFYGHLLKHMSKSSTKRCITCRLTFFNTMDVKNHKRLCHGWNQKEDPQKSSQSSKQDSFQKGRKKGSSLKSLNAPSISKIQDYGDVIFPSEAKTAKCVECKLSMSSMDHYKKFIHCSMCRFATSCSVAYANHMMGFHSGQMSSLNLNIPWERPMKELMYCNCGFPSKYGNKIANHLVFCTKTTCCSSKPKLLTSEGSVEKKEDGKKEDSLLEMLGLVQKKSVTTKVRTNQDKKGQQKKTPVAKSTKTVKTGNRKPGPKSKTTDIDDQKTDTSESKCSNIEQIDDVIILDEEGDKEDKDIEIVETTSSKLKELPDDTGSSKIDRVVTEVKDIQTEMGSKIETEVKDMKIEDTINLEKTEDKIDDELKMESKSQVVNEAKKGSNKVKSKSDEMFEMEDSGCKLEMPASVEISKNRTYSENLKNNIDASSAAKDNETDTVAGLEIVDSCNQNSLFTGLVENQQEALDETTMDSIKGSEPMEQQFDSRQENIVEPQELPEKFEHEMEVDEIEYNKVQQEMNSIQNNVCETDLNPDNTENHDIDAMDVENDSHDLEKEQPSLHEDHKSDHKIEFICTEEKKNVNLEKPKVKSNNLEVQKNKDEIATEVLQECKQDVEEESKSKSGTIKDQKQSADKLESDLLQEEAHSSHQELDKTGEQSGESKQEERTRHQFGECQRERHTMSVGQRDILQCKDGLQGHSSSERGAVHDHSTNKLDSRDHPRPGANLSEDNSRHKHESKSHYDSKARHNDRSSSSYHSSQRVDSYHSGRQSYDGRGYDSYHSGRQSYDSRGYDRNKDYSQDSRQGYSHQDNSDQGYGGSRGHQDSYSDYHGNQDNRSRGNYRSQGYGSRGGYNQQKYRDSYGGGYY